MSPDVFATHALPAAGEVVVGRSSEADVRLGDPRAPRRHLRLRVRDGQVEVEDLGSGNGTRLRNAALAAHAPTVLHPGEALAIGATILMVQQNRPPPAPRRAIPHGEFEG